MLSKLEFDFRKMDMIVNEISKEGGEFFVCAKQGGEFFVCLLSRELFDCQIDDAYSKHGLWRLFDFGEGSVSMLISLIFILRRRVT